MTYFEFYGIEQSFYPDLENLKNCYYEKSRLYHPDFFAQGSLESQAEALEKSSLNNKAFKVLSNFNSRIKYILELEEVLTEENKNTIPQMFLMEMLDFNEKVLELETKYSEEKYSKLTAELTAMEGQLLDEIRPALMSYGDGNKNKLEQIKDYHLKNRYLMRLAEKLDKLTN